MAWLNNSPLDDGENLVLEHQDGPIEFADAEAPLLQRGLQTGFERSSLDEARTFSTGRETTVSDSVDANDDEPAAPVRRSRTENARFSRDLADTYFRQVGDAELLSRAEEVALAKRIEAAQQAVLRGLCRVPMVVERIAGWADELSQGRCRLTDLIDLSMLDDALVVEGGAEHTGQASLVGREAQRASAGTACFQVIAGLASEIGALSRKRLAALARGRGLTKGGHTRLQELMRRVSEKTAGLRLQPERVSELLGEIEREQQRLSLIEQELGGIEGLYSTSRKDRYSRDVGAWACPQRSSAPSPSRSAKRAASSKLRAKR